MKNLQDYTDDEIGKELQRRHDRKEMETKARQSRCDHSVLSNLSISDEHDENGGGDSVTFHVSKWCQKCRKDMGSCYMTTYSYREGAQENFIKGLEELCKKFGRVF